MDKKLSSFLELAAKWNNVDIGEIICIYELLVSLWKNPYYIAQYLLIKSIDHRLAKKVTSPNDKVIDIGCGIPITAIILYHWGIKDVTCIDLLR